MREASWEECIKSSSARNISPDTKRAESLIETAEERIKVAPEMTDKNCNFVFEDHYTSILEMLQAMAFRAGFNVQNHICIGHYLKDALAKGDLYVIFDDIRYKRNSLVYYGKRMEYETARQAVEKCRKLIKEIRLMIK